MRSDPYRNIRHGMGVPLYMPGCHTLTDYFRHMQSRPESLYILPRVYGIMVREGCNTSVPPGAGGLIPPSHLVKGGMLQGGVPLQRRYSRGQGVCLPLLPFPLTMRVLGNTRLIAVRKPNSALLAINLWPYMGQVQQKLGSMPAAAALCWNLGRPHAARSAVRSTSMRDIPRKALKSAE